MTLFFNINPVYNSDISKSVITTDWLNEKRTALF